MIQPKESDFESQEQVDRAIAEYLEAIDQHQPLDRQQWLDRYAEIREELLDFLAMEEELNAELMPEPDLASSTGETTTGFVSSAAYARPRPRRAKISELQQIGPYTLVKLIGAGGMGQVYEAVDASGNAVAVKLLSPRWARSKESMQRFKQEGQIASRINHPRCVFVKTADEEGGQPYIVMELMTGKTLKDLHRGEVRLSVAKAVGAIIDVLDGLEEAHSHGMVHRDIKPANCYLETNGRVKVGDFGLARSMVSDSELTRTGDFVGTPLFASPEQVKGQTTDPRTDIYSVCATLYYLLTGQAPFAGSSPTSVIAKIVSEDPQSIRKLNPQVPDLLERVVMRGLQRDRRMRYQTVAELRQALEPFISGRQALAAWGRSLAAFGLDCILIGVLGGIVPIVWASQTANPIPTFPIYVLMVLPIVIYFLICEGWKNATIGKWLLRLHIVSRRTGEPPSRGRLIVRTLVAMLMMGILSDLLLYAIYTPRSPESWIAVQWLGYSITYSLLLTPLLVTRRSRMLLHDWLSGTMVADRPLISPQQQLAAHASEFTLPLVSAHGYPKQLGDFTVNGLICSSESNALLAGRDTKLRRDVWLHLRPAEEAELTAARRDCARTTRLRWLTSGREKEMRWDAFLAYQGAPLKHWTTPDLPLPWKNAREILRQLLEEFEKSAQDGTEVQVQSLDQIWMDARGRVAIVDWSPSSGIVKRANRSDRNESAFAASPESSAPAVSEKLNSDEHGVPLSSEQCGILFETARLALCGISKLGGGPADPIPAVLPLHARSILQSLADGQQDTAEILETTKILKALEESSTKAVEANLESRALGLGVAMLTCLMLLGVVASTARFGNFLIMARLCDRLVAPAAVDWLLSPNREADYAKATQLVNDFPSRSELTRWLADREALQLPLSEEFHLRYRSLGAFSRSVASGANLSQTPVDQLNQVRFEWQREELVAMNWTMQGNQVSIDLPLLARFVRSDPNALTLEFFRRSPLWLISITLSPLLAWMCWIALTRGGISLWFSGLSIVRFDGQPAGWILHFLRALLTVFPMLIVQLMISWIDLFYPGQLWISVVLYRVLIGLFVAYAVFTIAFPRRAPQDWLLGTFLVPK